MDSKNIKIGVVAILLLVVAYFAYGYITGDSIPPPAGGVTVTSGEGASVAQASGIDDPFFDLLLGLNTVTLSEKSLLSDPIFKDKMQDFSQPLPTPEIGRANPFLPVGSTTSATDGYGFNNNTATTTISTINTSSTTSSTTKPSGI